MQDENKTLTDLGRPSENMEFSAAKFAESYASFNRVINGLQRKYIELKEEFTAQNRQLAEANRRLTELTASNLAANEFLNGILDSMPVAVVTVDRQGKVTHLNPAGSILFSKDARKSVGIPYTQLYRESTDVTAGALETIKTGHPALSVEKELKLDNNRVLKLSVSTSVIKDENGLCVGAVEVFQDLTKIRKMEHEISRLNTLAALGEMAATIAHEVRNPLSGIGGFASLLERDIEDTDPKANLVQKIKKGVETLNNTVTKLLNYTRFNELNRSEIDFVAYIKSSLEQFRHNQTGGAEAEISFNDSGLTGPGDLMVSVDKLLFRQCLFNLLSNSIDATEQKAKISIDLTIHPALKIPVEFDNKINLDYDESLLVISVTDNGPGIKADHRDKIFAPFFTTKSSGSGLGLAVAWKLIKAHGGDIFLGESSPAGTTFHILLPANLKNRQLESEL